MPELSPPDVRVHESFLAAMAECRNGGVPADPSPDRLRFWVPTSAGADHG